jgi:superfamily II DNA/RNA helicase
VLVPTRELAEQVATVLASLAGRPERVTAVYGGTGYGPQRRALHRGVDILVACPGRLEDLIGSGDVRLDEVRVVVLDEADRMVDMGFLPPVRRLLDATPADRQLLLFSATIGSEVESIVARYQRQPLRCAVEAEGVADVTHHFWRTPRSERVAVTAAIVAHHGQTFVFCRTRHAADRVARQLRASGVEAVAIHGDRTQVQRAKALAAFSAGKADALVATDVVARGIHVDDVPCVVHFDPPGDADSYVHRSGRTGRTGRSGTVVSLVPDEVSRDVEALQRRLGLRSGLTEPWSPSQKGGPRVDRGDDGTPRSRSAQRRGGRRRRGLR